MLSLSREQIEFWDRCGWLLLPGVLDSAAVDVARSEAFDVFPDPDLFTKERERYSDLATDQFAAMATFPFHGLSLSLLCVHEFLLDCVDALLRSPNCLVYQAQLWAKYHGAVRYEQTHHRDYKKNTMLVTSSAGYSDFLEVFVYLSDIDEGHGPTAFVCRQNTKGIAIEPARFSRDELAFLYENEELAVGPAGSILFYAGDVFHRATDISTKGAMRLTLKLGIKNRSSTWVSYHQSLRVGFDPEWTQFVRGASRRQLEAVGFPPRSDSRWSDPAFLSDLRIRYGNIPGDDGM
jgi:Phytanoyl-CoA dioxygenase (PhyH)